jgi:hypothetical protein
VCQRLVTTTPTSFVPTTPLVQNSVPSWDNATTAIQCVHFVQWHCGNHVGNFHNGAGTALSMADVMQQSNHHQYDHDFVCRDHPFLGNCDPKCQHHFHHYLQLQQQQEVRDCILAQDAIGWSLVMTGLIANEWAVVQEAFMNKANETAVFWMRPLGSLLLLTPCSFQQSDGQSPAPNRCVPL